MIPKKGMKFVQLDGCDWEDVAPGVRRKITAYDDQIMGVYVEFKRSAAGALHSHPHVQISYVESGSFRVQIDGETSVLKAGDFFYVPTNAMHGAEALEDGVLIDMFSPMRQEFVPVPART